MKPSKRKRRIQAIKARLKEYYHLKEKNNYFKRNFIELDCYIEHACIIKQFNFITV